jgi:hypothetical protein
VIKVSAPEKKESTEEREIRQELAIIDQATQRIANLRKSLFGPEVGIDEFRKNLIGI